MNDFDQLLLQSKQGDRQALNSLMQKYGNLLKVLARTRMNRTLQGKVDASDIAQETAMLAVRDFTQFRGETEPEFASWLRSVLANVCASFERHYFGTKARDARREMSIHLENSSVQLNRLLTANGKSPSESAARRELAVVAADAIASLPEDCQEVIVRRHVDEQSISDIATELNKSRHAIRRLLARGIILLQEALEENHAH